jgi:hypothetical protein
MFRQFDSWIEGTHQAVLDHTGDDEGAARFASEVGFDGRKRSIGRERGRGQVRLGGDLFVSRFPRCTSLIRFGCGHELCLQ